MSLNAALTLFLEEYPEAVKQNFTNNPVANFIRNDVPQIINDLLDHNNRYLVHGSAGQGNWAHVPWVAIFDRLITESAQDGYFVVYLVCEDYSGIYLSLNQGVTSVRNIYGSDTKKALAVRASDYLARISNVLSNVITGELELKVESSNSLGAYYEKGAICSKYYARDNIPADSQLESDLNDMLNYYLVLTSKDVISASNTDIETDEQGLEHEDLRIMRVHKRIERNQKLSQQAKNIHGYTCQICRFNFEKKYGDIGKDFIEAHHLVPLSQLKGQRIALNPKKDFAVLCSNCHSMIHKTEYVSDINSFKNKYLNA